MQSWFRSGNLRISQLSMARGQLPSLSSDVTTLAGERWKLTGGRAAKLPKAHSKPFEVHSAAADTVCGCATNFPRRTVNSSRRIWLPQSTYQWLYAILHYFPPWFSVCLMWARLPRPEGLKNASRHREPEAKAVGPFCVPLSPPSFSC